MFDIKHYREFLKDSLRKTIDFRKSDQSKGRPAPPEELEVDPSFPRISLPDYESWTPHIGSIDLLRAMGERKSRRQFSNASLTLEELTFLLWATQGQRSPGKEPFHFRTVPSAGARHSFETYLFINRVEKLPTGLYRYLPQSNELILHYETEPTFRKKLTNGVFGQQFVANSAAVFVWTTVPYRMEWRYLEAAHRVILLDAGHVCQNLYLACEAINAGTCAIAAYDQEAMDNLLQIDGQDQFTLYLAPVGKKKNLS